MKIILWMFLATGCSSTVIVPGEDGAAAEIVTEDAGDAGDAEDPCATCAHTEWFCAGYFCGTANCSICQNLECQPKDCTMIGMAEVNYPTWCCP